MKKIRLVTMTNVEKDKIFGYENISRQMMKNLRRHILLMNCPLDKYSWVPPPHGVSCYLRA